MQRLRLAGNHCGFEGLVHLVFAHVVTDHALEVLKDFLERRLVGLLEGEKVLAVGLCEEGHVFDLAPALKVLVAAESLHAVGVLREVPVVEAPVVPQQEAAQIQRQL